MSRRILISLFSFLTLWGMQGALQAQTSDTLQAQVSMRAAPQTVSSQLTGPFAPLLAASSFDTFDGFVRFPSEVNNRSFQFQQNGAYYRDFFTGGETH